MEIKNDKFSVWQFEPFFAPFFARESIFVLIFFFILVLVFSILSRAILVKIYYVNGKSLFGGSQFSLTHTRSGHARNKWFQCNDFFLLLHLGCDGVVGECERIRTGISNGIEYKSRKLKKKTFENVFDYLWIFGMLCVRHVCCIVCVQLESGRDKLRFMCDYAKTCTVRFQLMRHQLRRCWRGQQYQRKWANEHSETKLIRHTVQFR